MLYLVDSVSFKNPLSGDAPQSAQPNIDDINCPKGTKATKTGKPMDKLTAAILELAERAGVDAEEIAAVRQITAGAKAAELRARQGMQD